MSAERYPGKRSGAGVGADPRKAHCNCQRCDDDDPDEPDSVDAQIAIGVKADIELDF